MTGAVPPLPPYNLMACTGTALSFMSEGSQILAFDEFKIG
jgi:hypothetical protein